VGLIDYLLPIIFLLIITKHISQSSGKSDIYQSSGKSECLRNIKFTKNGKAIVPDCKVCGSPAQVFAEPNHILLLVGEEGGNVSQRQVLYVHPQPNQLNIFAIL
jgi:hypothetical protein